MLIWGGTTNSNEPLPSTGGGIYYPGSKRWYSLPPTEQVGRFNHSTVWTGQEMIVWGGKGDLSSEVIGDGWIYDYKHEDWLVVTAEGAPAARAGHSAVWTGKQMIIWGGEGVDGFLGDGAMYDPKADKWTPLPTLDAPSARGYHSVVWTGKKMIVWGGLDNDGALDSGAVFDPKAGTWTEMAPNELIYARVSHTAVWTGKQMIVWGGRGDDEEFFGDGAIYDLNKDTWLPLAADKAAPSQRELHTATWTGKEMIVFGGQNADGMLDDGAIYSPKTGRWTKLRMKVSPGPRAMHTAVWSGDSLVIFGGEAGKRRAGAMVIESNDDEASEDGAEEVADGESDGEEDDEPAEEPKAKLKTGLQIRMSKKQP